jgi:hypothetical protein
MKRRAPETSPHSPEPLTIRMAIPADAVAVGRLAQLDSARPPGPVPMLLAEVGGELRAAVALDGGRAIADPFHRTAELVALLVERARQITSPGPRRDRRRRHLVRAARPVLARDT